MNMKKKTAVLMTGVIMASMVFVTGVSADSMNNVNKIVSIKDGSFYDDVYLKIQPYDEVKMGDTIRLSIENGKFGENIDKYQYKLGGMTYEKLKAAYGEASPDFSPIGVIFDNVMEELMSENMTSDLPYYLRRKNDKELEVELFVCPEDRVNESIYGCGKPSYRIPLPFTAVGSSQTTVEIDSMGTSIRGGWIYVIATAPGTGEDTLSKDNILPIYQSVAGSNNLNKVVLVKENDFNDEVYLKIQPGGEVKLGDKIRLFITNGKFGEDVDKYQYKLGGMTYERLKADYENMSPSYSSTLTVFDNVMRNRMDTERTNALPYYLRRKSDKELEVELFACPGIYAGERIYGLGTPMYKIPLPFTVMGSRNVMVTVDSIGAPIRGGETYIIGKNAVDSEDNIKRGTLDINVGNHFKAVLEEKGNILWESSDKDVVSVGTDGVLTGIGEGTCDVTAQLGGCIIAKYSVTVNKAENAGGSVLGDVDGDGILTAGDVSLLLEKVLDAEFVFPKKK